MALDEFGLIERYFTAPAPDDLLSVGDDAAILPMTGAESLVACKDVLIQGRHFFPDVDPESIGHKSLAVNLSDLAAMGATPKACLLGLALPGIEEPWVQRFSRGFLALADQWGCPLVGGDTVASQGGIVISVTALGTLAASNPGLRRSSASVGDDVWLSGDLGAPDVALRIMLGELKDPGDRLPILRRALEWPQPRVLLGQRLLGLATAAIDVSDGLLQDLGHILTASNVGARLWLDSLPVHSGLAGFNSSIVEQAALSGGDVYELCFCAPVDQREAIAGLGHALALRLTRIGQITDTPGLFGQYADGKILPLETTGFNHFKDQA